MSESPEQRTKRVFSKALTRLKPSYQISLVFNPDEYNEDEHEDFLNELPRFKRRLADLFDYPILTWIQTKAKKGVVLPVLCMFFAEKPSNNERRKIKVSVDKIFYSCPSINVLNRVYTTDRLNKRITTVKYNPLHNLKHVFHGNNVNRFSIINRAKMP